MNGIQMIYQPSSRGPMLILRSPEGTPIEEIAQALRALADRKPVAFAPGWQIDVVPVRPHPRRIRLARTERGHA